MTTQFIANIAVTLPPRFAAGDILDETGSRVLQSLWLKRINTKLRWLRERGDIDAQGLQAKATELAQADLAPYSVAEDADDDDPVLIEALDIAKSLITARMAAEGLPPPKGLDTHARELVNSLPQLVERARMRVEARYKAAVSLLGEMQ